MPSKREIFVEQSFLAAARIAEDVLDAVGLQLLQQLTMSRCHENVPPRLNDNRVRRR